MSQAAKSTTGSTSTNNTVEHDDEYEVEKIVGWKVDSKDFWLRVRWAGYGLSDDTWEREKSLTINANEVVQDYYKNMSEMEKGHLMDQLKARTAINLKLRAEEEKRQKMKEAKALLKKKNKTMAAKRKTGGH